VTAEVGDARRLTQVDASVDAVLLLGPLYLVGRAERIGRFMAVLDWAQCGGLTADVAARLVSVLATGVHDSTSGSPMPSSAAQLQQEVAEAGFADVRVLGIEGPAWTSWTHPATTPTRALTAHCAAPS
jgi:hypothetical protein